MKDAELLSFIKERIENETIDSIGHCLDLVWIGFGQEKPRYDIVTKQILIDPETMQQEMVYRFALHLQTDFQILRKDDVLYDSCAYEFDQAALDQIVGEIRRVNARVIDVWIGAQCELVIRFSRAYELRVATYPTEKETWRFFESGEDDLPHIVCRGTTLSPE